MNSRIPSLANLDAGLSRCNSQAIGEVDREPVAILGDHRKFITEISDLTHTSDLSGTEK